VDILCMVVQPFCFSSYSFRECHFLKQVCAWLRPFSRSCTFSEALPLVAMVVCKQCRQTASVKCCKQLCGGCCVPPCLEGVHNQRHSSRGVEGGARRSRHIKFWTVAEQLAGRWLDGSMVKRWRDFYKLDYNSTRSIFLKAIKGLVADPLCDNDDTRHPIVSAVCPPGELEHMIAKLRTQFNKKQMLEVDLKDLEARVPEVANDLPCDASSGSVHGQKVDEKWRIPRSTDHLDHKRAHYDDELPQKEIVVAEATSNDDERIVFNLAPWAPGDKPARDSDGRPCSHYLRTEPLLYAGSLKVKQPRLVELPRSSSYALAEKIFLRWTQQRPGLQKLLHQPKRCKYIWTASESEEGHALLHSEGVWLWCKASHWIPVPPPGTNIKEKTLQGNDFETSIHASNMYMLHRAMMQGLQPGPDVGKGGKTGVYAFRPNGMRQARASSGYAVYSDLANNGLYFSPRFQLEMQMWKAGTDGVGKISVGDNQLVLQPGMFHISGVWIHVLSGEDIKSGTMTWTQIDDWDPQYELGPHVCVD
jgi:hypothetical protein